MRQRQEDSENTATVENKILGKSMEIEFKLNYLLNEYIWGGGGEGDLRKYLIQIRIFFLDCKRTFDDCINEIVFNRSNFEFELYNDE